MRPHQLVCSILFTLLLFNTATLTTSQGFYPCHASKKSPSSVSCKHVRLPSTLCSSCPLRQPGDDGHFVKCTDIYDTSSTACQNDFQKYVDANPCDTERADALNAFLSDSSSDIERNQARSAMDYFLYSVCENCCDCVPMGRKVTEYDSLSYHHNTITKPALWDENRGNCPAHAVFDVCNALPNVQYFSRIEDDDTVNADWKSQLSGVAACNGLNAWRKSDEAIGWQENPKTQITDNVRVFLRGLLYASKCTDKGTWTRCFNLENRQQHLSLPGDSFLPPVTPRPSLSSTSSPSPIPSASSTSTASLSPTPTSSTTPSALASNSQLPSISPTPTSSQSPDSPLKSTTATSTSFSPSSLSSTNSSTSSNSSNSSTSTADTNENSCFPSSALVELETGEQVSISNVKIGTKIRTSRDTYSPIFLFTHRDPHTRLSTFVTITISSNHSITLHRGHFIPTRDHSIIAANEVRTGVHALQIASTGEWKTVARVQHSVKERGLYNVHTTDGGGNVVVNGIVTSCYTKALHPITAHGYLSVFRAIFNMGLIRERTFGSLWNFGVL